MTREEAIEYLQANMPDPYYEKLREAVQIAIETLKQPELKRGHWITKPTNGINAYTCKCSCCGWSINCDSWRDPIAFDDAEYCLRCGAKMD